MKRIRLPLVFFFLLGWGISNVQAQCISIRFNMAMEEVSARKNTLVQMPLHVDFTDVYMGVGKLEIFVHFDPEVLDFSGINNLDASIKGATASLAEPGKVRIFWTRSTFQGIMQTSLVGKLLDIGFYYKGGTSPVTFGEVTIWDIWSNMWMGEYVQGSLKESPSYTLSLVSNPPGIGAVFTGAGNHYPNDEVFIHVDEPLNYKFKNWKSNLAVTGVPGNPVSRETSFHMTAFDIGITANFEQIHADPVFLTLAFEGEGDVRIGSQSYSFSGGQQTLVFNRGDAVSLLAEPAPEWGFTQWKDDLQVANRQATLVMNGDKTITARFSKMQPVLFLEVEGNGEVLVNGEAYEAGAHAITLAEAGQVSLTQQAAEGWVFGQWLGDVFENGSSSLPTASVFVAPGMLQVKAVFEKLPDPVFTLKVNVVGEGQVVVDEVVYTEEQAVVAGTIVTLAPDPGESWVFDAWSGAGLSGNAESVSLLMDGDREVTATFVQTFPLALLADPADAGAGTEGNGNYREGMPVTISADAIEGYHFTGWSGSDEDVALLDDPESMSATLVMPGRELTLTASYLRLYQVTFLVNMSYVDGLHHPLTFHAGTGQVGLAGNLYEWDTMNTTADFSMMPTDDDPMVWALTLQLPAGTYAYSYYLDEGTETPEWTGDASRTFTIVDEDVVLTDWFGSESEPVRKYVVSAGAESHGTISPSGDVVVSREDTLSFLITPDEGYHVADVLLDGVSLGAVDSYTLENISGHHVIVVRFEINTYTVSYGAGENAGIEGDAAQEVTHGNSGTPVLAVPAEGYVFTGWSDGRTDNPRTDTIVTANISVTALFAVKTWSITVSANEGGSLTPGGDMTVKHGDDLVVEITPDTGYHIADVLLDDVSQGAVSSLPLTGISSDHHIVVVFAINMYTITLSAGDHGSIDPGEDVSVPHGGEVTFTITPDEGYHIEEILVDGVSHGQAGVLTLSDITRDHVVAVSFALTTYSLRFEVKNAATGDLITDAVITINGVAYDAGQYTIQQMVPDTYDYIVSREGFFETAGSVTLDNADQVVSVGLTVDNTNVKDVVLAGMKAYPNPAAGMLWVEFTNESTNAGVFVALYNLQGKLVKQVPVHDPGHVQIQLDLQGMHPGVYLLTIQGGEQLFPARQIMVRL